jgi:hypothetical protein
VAAVAAAPMPAERMNLRRCIEPKTPEMSGAARAYGTRSPAAKGSTHEQ